MNKTILKKINILNIMNNSLIKLPTPLNISIWWNFGSMLGVSLMMQIISGLFLSMHYCANASMAFTSMIHIIQDINYGWMFRLIHMNGASLYFMCMFIHIGRGIYYGSFNLNKTWLIGLMIFFISMATAFMGYVLPWGQMSFWGATVITNLVSTIPYIGISIVEWLWGGFSVNNPTLNRFYTFHFILPFIVMSLVLLHLMMIHETGSNNPLGTSSYMYMIPFNSYFTLKDLIGFMMMITLLMLLIMIKPFMLSDPENFIIANPMVTPIHIQPEWYFLFAYTILRSIPNKLGGVIALLMSILMLLTLSIINFKIFQSNKFSPLNQSLFWLFTSIVLILTWLGSKPVEYPFIEIGQLMTLLYFSFFLINPLIFNTM